MEELPRLNGKSSLYLLWPRNLRGRSWSDPETRVLGPIPCVFRLPSSDAWLTCVGAVSFLYVLPT